MTLGISSTSVSCGVTVSPPLPTAALTKALSCLEFLLRQEIKSICTDSVTSQPEPSPLTFHFVSTNYGKENFSKGAIPEIPQAIEEKTWIRRVFRVETDSEWGETAPKTFSIKEIH
jgi:hypothetical protein